MSCQLDGNWLVIAIQAVGILLAIALITMLIISVRDPNSISYL